jgi:hypothetical protein
MFLRAIPRQVSTLKSWWGCGQVCRLVHMIWSFSLPTAEMTCIYFWELPEHWRIRLYGRPAANQCSVSKILHDSLIEDLCLSTKISSIAWQNIWTVAIWKHTASLDTATTGRTLLSPNRVSCIWVFQRRCNNHEINACVCAAPPWWWENFALLIYYVMNTVCLSASCDARFWCLLNFE